MLVKLSRKTILIIRTAIVQLSTQLPHCAIVPLLFFFIWGYYCKGYWFEWNVDIQIKGKENKHKDDCGLGLDIYLENNGKKRSVLISLKSCPPPPPPPPPPLISWILEGDRDFLLSNTFTIWHHLGGDFTLLLFRFLAYQEGIIRRAIWKRSEQHAGLFTIMSPCHFGKRLPLSVSPRSLLLGGPFSLRCSTEISRLELSEHGKLTPFLYLVLISLK